MAKNKSELAAESGAALELPYQVLLMQIWVIAW